jgi:methylase of polypeptide subunit release factors
LRAWASGFGRVEVVDADLFPAGQASISIVCNPPWLPGRAGTPLERAVYDPGSRMLLGFIAGLAAHLAAGGEGWLILSDLAEQLGLRSRAELLAAFAAAGLEVAGRLDAKPVTIRAPPTRMMRFMPRGRRETTSLWRLRA